MSFIEDIGSEDIENVTKEITIRRIKGELREWQIIRNRQGEIISQGVFIDRRKNTFIEQDYKLRDKLYFKKGQTSMVMRKKVPDNIMKGLKDISSGDFEYSIALDFERLLETPETIVLLKGGAHETVKINDFELFGHTHPNNARPTPSNADLLGLDYLIPEFIIAGKNGKISFINIIDFDKFENYKKTHTYEKMGPNSSAINFTDIYNAKRRKSFKGAQYQDITNWNYYNSKPGREMFKDITGVEIIPYRKTLTIETIDDPHIEKKLPTIPTEKVRKYHLSIK